MAQVAVAQWEIEIQDKGCTKSRLVLAPLHEGLFCAILPASDFLKASLQHAQRETELEADCAPLSNIPFETVEYLQGEDLNNNQVNAFAAAGTPVQSDSAGVDVGPIGPHLEQWYENNGLYDGAGMETMRGHTCGVTQDTQDIM